MMTALIHHWQEIFAPLQAAVFGKTLIAPGKDPTGVCVQATSF
jgi:hypothetical protein